MQKEKLLLKKQFRWLYLLVLFFCMSAASFAQSGGGSGSGPGGPPPPPGSYGQWPTLLVNEDDAPAPSACGDSDTYTVTVRNGGTACSSAKLKVTLPSGFEYKQNSVSVTPNTATATQESVQGQVLMIALNLPAATPATGATNFKVSFKAKANCTTIATAAASPDQKPKIAYELILTSCGFTNQSGFGQVINVNFAALQTTVTPAVSVQPVGAVIERTIKVKNTGNGKLKSFKVKATLGSGLQLADNTIPVVAGYTVTHAGDEYTFTAQGTDFLDPGEIVSFTRKVKVVNCNNLIETYKATYGCGTTYQDCSYTDEAEATKIIQTSIDATVRPRVLVDNDWSESEANGSRPASRYCFDTDYYRIFKIQNTGQATALNYRFTIWTMSNSENFSTYFYDQYELSEDQSFSGVTLQTPIVKDNHTHPNTALTGVQGQVKGMTITIPTIEVGKTYYLRFKLRNNNYLPGAACDQKPVIFNYAYIQYTADYQTANTCGTSPIYPGGNRTTQSAVHNYFGAVHESSFSAIPGQELPMRLRTNFYHNPGNIKPGL